ncbi:CBS domain-containing protein [uncultured Methanobrevibacter sp.]|uniref:CBS domain-containing protein n=1 Tax=uncultured Methanobrevibacter sp. TaxID=253161 RepID=UPI002626FBA8
MKAKEMMDEAFIFVSKDDLIVDVSIKMEESRRFTAPVLDDSMKLVGWITSFNITKGLREGKSTIEDVMSPVSEIMFIGENEPARNIVIETSKNKLISIPIINDENQVIGVSRSVDIVDSMSALYDIKVKKIYEAMEEELRGITWEELMDASAKISTRTTGVKITPEEYERNIENATFGEAIWATGGLEKFFAGLISVGEIVIARKVGRARR